MSINAELDWLLPYKERIGLHIPLMYETLPAVNKFRIAHFENWYDEWPPMMVVIDKDGTIVVRDNKIDYTIEEMEGVINDLLSE